MGLSDYWQRSSDRRLLRRAPPALGFALEPEPPPLGLYARGRQIAGGSFLLAGHLAETHDPWSFPAPNESFAAELHGWGWLEHLAAYGDAQARAEAQRWLTGWLDSFSMGAGPGWTAELTGRRVLRWLQHGVFLTADADPGLVSRYFAALGAQVAFLARAHSRAPAGLRRVEALTGWLHGALMLRGLEDHALPALTALARTADELVDAEGAIASRNPEELLWMLAHFGWSIALAERSARPVPPALTAARGRAAQALRVLIHADGGLARFHGGGAGPEGLAERVLAEAAPGARRRPASRMGFVRLEGGRTTLIVDAAAPPAGPFGTGAQASTLAFELTSGRRPLIVSCGPGQGFGADWQMAARATSAHSTLSLDGVSSSRFEREAARRGAGQGAGMVGPRSVSLHRSDERDGTTLLLSHDGWLTTHGLTHSRSLQLSSDGRTLLGSDELAAPGPEDQARLSRALAAQSGRGIGYALRFHLHPDVDPSVDTNGRAISITLPSGERWIFRFDGRVNLSLDPSVWLEPGRRAPRSCRQIVLKGALTGAGVQINWTLAKGQDTPLAIRDIGRDEEMVLPPDFFDRD